MNLSIVMEKILMRIGTGLPKILMNRWKIGFGQHSIDFLLTDCVFHMTWNYGWSFFYSYYCFHGCQKYC